MTFRSEFGAYLIYFYICDRTNLFGESKKVDFSFMLDDIVLLMEFTMIHTNKWLQHYAFQFSLGIYCAPTVHPVRKSFLATKSFKAIDILGYGLDSNILKWLTSY